MCEFLVVEQRSVVLDQLSELLRFARFPIVYAYAVFTCESVLAQQLFWRDEVSLRAFRI